MIQGINWEANLGPRKTNGEIFPCFWSSLIWWKWEQNKTIVIANAGLLPKRKDSLHGILERLLLSGFKANSEAENAKGPKAVQQSGSPNPW